MGRNRAGANLELDRLLLLTIVIHNSIFLFPGDVPICVSSGFLAF